MSYANTVVAAASIVAGVNGALSVVAAHKKAIVSLVFVSFIIISLPLHKKLSVRQYCFASIKKKDARSKFVPYVPRTKFCHNNRYIHHRIVVQSTFRAWDPGLLKAISHF